MEASFMCAALMLTACTGLMACSQAGNMASSAGSSVMSAGSSVVSGVGSAASGVGQAAVAAVTPASVERARTCTTRGQPANAGVSQPWAITVSNEGAWCTHSRLLGDANQIFDLKQAPQHGQVVQQSKDGKTLVSYRPAKGYVGTDNFMLRYPNRAMDMPYMVNIIP